MKKQLFPLKAKFIRKDNRIYTIMDFENNEDIHFYNYCEKPNANAGGYAFYYSEKNGIKLVHISDLKVKGAL